MPGMTCTSVSAQLLRPLALLVVLTCLFAGCDNRPEPIEPATGTPAEIFMAEQDNVETPYGEIDMSTVVTASENSVRYQTTSGELFEVEMEEAADGTHRWVNLRKVTDPE